MLQELFWAHFFGLPYHSNVNKIHLDVALLILVHSLLISLQLCCFCMKSLLQLFYHCSYSFFPYVILPFKFLIFFFPPYLSSLVTFWDGYVFLDFIYRFFNPSFPPGFQFLFIFTSKSF